MFHGIARMKDCTSFTTGLITAPDFIVNLLDIKKGSLSIDLLVFNELLSVFQNFEQTCFHDYWCWCLYHLYMTLFLSKTFFIWKPLCQFFLNLLWGFVFASSTLQWSFSLRLPDGWHVHLTRLSVFTWSTHGFIWYGPVTCP